MVHIQHIGAHGGDDLQKRRQRVGLVGQHGGEAHRPPLLGKAAGEDALQHGHVHISTGQQSADGLALGVHLVVHGGGDAHGARALGHQLLLFQHRQDGAGDLALADRHHLVHILPAHVEGQVAGGLDLNAVGHGVHAGEGDDLPLLQGFRHAGRTGSLHAHDAAVGLQVLHGVGKTGDQPAAADGHEDHVHVRQLLQNFKADGALPRHDAVVVEGMDERQPLLIPQAHRLSVGVVVHAGHQHHVGAVAAGGLDLGDRRALGDADGGLDAHVPGSVGHALGVVPGGAGDDAPRLLLVGEGGDLVVRAPELERAGFLQAVGLQIEVAAGHQPLGGDHRRAVDDGLEHPLGIVQHGHGDHRTRLLICIYVYFTIAHPSAQYGQQTKFPFLSSLHRHSNLSRTHQKNSGSSAFRS